MNKYLITLFSETNELNKLVADKIAEIPHCKFDNDTFLVCTNDSASAIAAQLVPKETEGIRFFLTRVMDDNRTYAWSLDDKSLKWVREILPLPA